MLRVVHVLTDSNIGGAGHILLALLNREKGLSRSEFDITVLLPKNAALLPALTEQGIKCIKLPYLAEKSFSLKAVGVLLKQFKKIKPNIVHTHAALSGRVAAKLYGKCKIVHTRHSVFEPTARQQRFPFKQMLGFINNFFSHAIIAVSPAAADNLIKLGTRKSKIFTIYNGTPPAKLPPKTEKDVLHKQYNIPQGTFVLLQLARLTKVKGQEDVLDVAKLLPNTLFLIAGEGDLRPILEERIKKEGINNVRLLGFVTEVDELLAISDAQISASFGTEATSLSLIQGMSVGVPAIVSDYGGNPYVIESGKNGLVFEARNVNAFAECIKTLQNSPTLYNDLANNAMQIYKEKFTLEKMASDTDSLYRKVLTK